MSDWPVGLSTGCFYQKSLVECLEPIRNGGFGMIEISSSPRHLDYREGARVKEAARRLRELGIEAYSFHAPFADRLDFTSPSQGQREKALEDYLAAADAAAELGSRYFVIHPGPEMSLKPSSDEYVRRMWYAAETLNTLAERCRELGVGFALENMLPHLLFGNTRDMLWLLGALKSVHAGVCLDTGHAHLSGDIYRVMHKLSGNLQLVHADDNHGERDDHLPPGKGLIDWRRVTVSLAASGFHGGVILELHGDDQRPVEQTLDAARQSRLFLRGVFRSLDLSAPPTVEAILSPNAWGTQGRPSR